MMSVRGNRRLKIHAGWGRHGRCAMIAAVGATLGMTGIAVHGQDSVSATDGLPGDAVNAFATGVSQEQVNNYVLDLTPMVSSWGNQYALGPMAKASRGGVSLIFGLNIGASAMSSDFSAGTMVRTSYSIWNTRGQGIATGSNTTPGTLSTPSLHGWRFGSAFMEYGFGTDAILGSADDEQQVITTVTGFTSANPNRLYVSRIVALTNKLNISTQATSSFGLGGVDELGNVAVLGDSYGVFGTGALLQPTLARVASLTRNTAVVNRMQESGFGDAAASVFVRKSGVLLSTPTLISSQLAGGVGRPVVLDADLASNFLYENVAGAMVSSRAQFGGVLQPQGLRSPISFTPGVFAPVSGGSGVGLCAGLAKVGAVTGIRQIQVWGVDGVGTPVGTPMTIELPTIAGNLMDPTDSFVPGNVFAPATDLEFVAGSSQGVFRGPSPVAMRVLNNGDLLVAALISPRPGNWTPTSMDNSIVAARVTPTGVVSWSVVAHTGNAAGYAGGLSKIIRGDYGADGVPGTLDAGEGDGVLDATPIGKLAKTGEALMFKTSGPSLSYPALDGDGNVYFVASVILNTPTGLNKTLGLMRANRNPGGGGAGAFELELLLKVGDVFAGPHSTRNYQIQRLALGDSDSPDSGGLCSASLTGEALPGAVPGTLGYGAPGSLGAMVVRARICYDVNQNSAYDDPSAVSISTSGDQAYNAVLVIMPRIRPGDFNRSSKVDVADIFAFLNAWFGQFGQSGAGLTADSNADGNCDVSDIFAFLNDWFANFGS